jgi:hypothetical protein
MNLLKTLLSTSEERSIRRAARRDPDFRPKRKLASKRPQR